MSDIPDWLPDAFRGEIEQFNALLNIERQKIGDFNRVNYVVQWLQGTLGKEQTEALLKGIHTAESLQDLETITGMPSHSFEKYAASVVPIPARKQQPQDFYQTSKWRRLRYEALKLHGSACQCCGERAKPAHVDHIKPRSKYPKLEYELSNLQILCQSCNSIKADKDETDWREK